MITKIFWDIDETLIHTELHAPDQEHVVLQLNDANYYTIIRPCAKSLIEFSRELVGFDNVYILTTATTDYAREVNRLAGWEFAHNHIIAREEISNHEFGLAYGGAGVMRHKVADRNNVLIDNLPARHNAKKIDLIGITEDRYFNIRDYYGVNFPNDPFETDVKNFLLNKNENTTDTTNDGGNG